MTKLNAGSNPTVQEESDKQYFYHSDHLGSASLISDCEGNEYQRIEYTPYGEIWVEKTENNGLAYLPYKFTGKEMDEETGLYYYGARYLDPKYSKWISTDPALGEYIPKAPINEEARRYNQNLPGMGGVFNPINGGLYAYAANNPVRYIDPDGRAVTIKAGNKYYVRSQGFLEIVLFEKIQSSSYPFFGDQFTEFFYWLHNEKKIEDSLNESNSNIITNVIDKLCETNDNISFFNDSVSFLAQDEIRNCFDPKTRAVLKRADRIISIAAHLQTSYEIYRSYNNLERMALEDFCCSYFNRELSSNSHEKSSALYLFAMASLANLYEQGAFSLEYETNILYRGHCVSYKIHNEEMLNHLRDMLKKLQEN